MGVKGRDESFCYFGKEGYMVTFFSRFLFYKKGLVRLYVRFWGIRLVVRVYFRF